MSIINRIKQVTLQDVGAFFGACAVGAVFAVMFVSGI